VARAAPFILAAIVVVQAGRFIASTSATVDETMYLTMAEATFRNRGDAEYGVKGIAPLPVVLQYALPATSPTEDFAQKIVLARLSAVAFVAVPLILVIYFWLATQLGAAAAFIAAAIVALSPNVVANSVIAGTDACFVLFALLLLWALSEYVERPSWLRLAALVAAGGFAFAAKYSAIALFGVAAVVLAWRDRPERPLSTRAVYAAAVVVAMAAAGIALSWRFHPIAGLFSQINHQRLGHEAFLLGSRNNQGWWYYQPVALAVKSTYVELIAFGLAIAAAATLGREPLTVVRIWLVAAAVVAVGSMISRVDIGVRYVLLLVPLAVMTATVWVMRVSHRRWIAAAIGVAALAVQGATAVAIAPRYLSYFNAFAGGPMNGYRWLVDSNLDWGQDLPAMRRFLERVGARDPVASYFGTAPPGAYGVNVWLWNLCGADVKARTDWVVISATHLAGLYVPNDAFAAFRALKPFARPTPALFVYDGSRQEVKDAVADAAARSR
jgi:4-amino-4-deoxy-L-arabinose transferase-like glycosyltransferase